MTDANALTLEVKPGRIGPSENKTYYSPHDGISEFPVSKNRFGRHRDGGHAQKRAIQLHAFICQKLSGCFLSTGKLREHLRGVLWSFII